MPNGKVRAILLDIEGTTTPVAFVYEVLFPYARSHLREFIEQNYHADDLRADISALRVEHKSDIEQGLQPPPWLENLSDQELESVTRYVYWLMDRDRKSKALKSLQGKIWEGGYKRGSLKGDVYPDVVPACIRWRRQQRSIYIFSSGSVLAQKLLFAHTTEGDLTSFISGYFDTSTGPKTKARSYQTIAAQIGSAANEILFVSDVTAELDAAREAGMETAFCVRSVDSNSTTSIHSTITTFDTVFP